MNSTYFWILAAIIIFGFYNTEKGLDRVENSLCKRIKDLESKLQEFQER